MQPHYKRVQQAHARLRLLEDAERLGNVSQACRLHKVSRTCFYKWKRRYDGTVESLMDQSRRPKSHPRQLTDDEHNLVRRVALKHKRAGRPSPVRAGFRQAAGGRVVRSQGRVCLHLQPGG